MSNLIRKRLASCPQPLLDDHNVDTHIKVAKLQKDHMKHLANAVACGVIATHLAAGRLSHGPGPRPNFRGPRP